MSKARHTPHPFKELKPYLESTALAFIAYLVTLQFGETSGINGLSPQLFWVPILLMVAQYGTFPALWCVVVSTILLYSRYIPRMLPSDDFYSYWWRVGLTPVIWFIAATVLGELVMRHRRGRRKIQDQLATVLEREKVFLKAFAELEELKDQREHELAALTCSPAQIFKIISTVDPKTQESIINCVLDLVGTLLQPKKYSLYLVRGSALRLVRSHGWTTSDSFTEKFLIDTPIYREVITLKRELSVTEPLDRSTLENQGLIAVPLFDAKSMNIFGMLKIERAEWSQITLEHRATLKMAAQWAGGMFSYAQHFKVAYLMPLSGKESKESHDQQQEIN